VGARLDPDTEVGARALAQLAADPIGWLTTVDPTGRPTSSPIWFLWDGHEIVVYSHRRARRNADIATQPQVSFHLNSDEWADELLTMEGTARIDPDGSPATSNPEYLAKYEAKILTYGWTLEWFASEYPVVVRITPERWRT